MAGAKACNVSTSFWSSHRKHCNHMDDPDKLEKASTKSSTISDDSHAQKLHDCLDQYSKDQKLARRPTLIFSALVCLFASSVFGIILAGITLARPIDATAACISRDLILFASVFSWFYIALHIRAARRDYLRLLPGPPQHHGNYLHASALLVARLAICIWVSALIAVSAMVAMSAPARGFAGAVPYLDLLICIGAIPAFVIISATIETNTVPFATACVSKPSLLTCRVSDFADDLAADMSISRRASLSRAQPGGATPVTLPTTPGVQTGGSATPAIKKPTEVKTVVKSKAPITEGVATPDLPLVSPPPTYNPGGWPTEVENTNNTASKSTTTTTTTAVASPGSISPAATASPASEVPPESGATTPSTYSVPSTSYFTNNGVSSFSPNKRPNGPRAQNSRPSLIGRTSSGFMTSGLSSPAATVRTAETPSQPSTPMYPRPAPARASSGVSNMIRPAVGRNYSSIMGVTQRSKLSTVQYAEDFDANTPTPSSTAPTGTAASSSSGTTQSSSVTQRDSVPRESGGLATMTPAIAKAPAGPRPLPITPPVKAAPNPPKAPDLPMEVPMPGCMPNPYWLLRKAQYAQRTSLPVVPERSPASEQGQSFQQAASGSASGPKVPAPYFEDVPDEGEPQR